jgi:peptidoglycan/xylan/chitin deacetylase (PgdA/CDA1 family)
MYFPQLITGRSMPDRTLCLSYDDGPAPGTLPLGEYLHALECPATFFMLGRHAEQFPDASARLRALGHGVGNHSYSHPDLVAGLAAKTDHADDIHQAEILLRDGADRPVFFRPPFGSWSPGVAQALNAHPALASRHVGPIYWDFDSRDWEYCRHARRPGECADAALRQIELRRRGIVLMHDGQESGDSAAQAEFALRVTQLLVPRLLALGYRIIPLDQVPEIAAILEGQA